MGFWTAASFAAIQPWPLHAPSCSQLLSCSPAVHSSAPSCLRLKAHELPGLLLPGGRCPLQRTQKGAPSGSLLCPQSGQALPSVWPPLALASDKALLQAAALMASLGSLRWLTISGVCCCSPWPS